MKINLRALVYTDINRHIDVLFKTGDGEYNALLINVLEVITQCTMMFIVCLFTVFYDYFMSSIDGIHGRVMASNATFITISVISWRSIVLVCVVNQSSFSNDCHKLDVKYISDIIN